jgi:hypothetical protein
MTPREAHEAAGLMDDLVEALLDQGVLAPEDLPPSLAQSLGRRRVILQKLFGGPARPGGAK